MLSASAVLARVLNGNVSNGHGVLWNRVTAAEVCDFATLRLSQCPHHGRVSASVIRYYAHEWMLLTHLIVTHLATARHRNLVPRHRPRRRPPLGRSVQPWPPQNCSFCRAHMH
jgi:hypothetical protein